MDNTNKGFTIVREFDSPAERVFDAWTDPEQVSEWWGPQGVFTPVCEIDAKAGGKIHIIMEAGAELGPAKGMKWPVDGVFEEVEKNTKLVFTSNSVNDGKEYFKYRTTVTFDEKNGKTTMTVHVAVTEIQPGAEFAIPGMEQGWNSQFDKLVEFIKKEN